MKLFMNIHRPVKKCFVVCVMLALSISHAHSEKVSGMTIDSGRLYYIIQNHVYCRDIADSALIWKKDLYADTHVVNSVVATMKKLLNIKGDTALNNARAAISDFVTMNITCYNRKIYIGIKYHTVKHLGQRTWFALLEFNSSLKFLEHYVFVMKTPFRYFSLPPYHPLHFTSSGTLLMPLYHETKMQLFNFTLLKKNHKAFPTTPVYHDIGIVRRMVFHVGEYIYSEPMLYPVPNSGFQYFFQYPFPLVRRQNRAEHDPYHMRPFLDSFDKTKKEFGYYNSDLNFPAARKAYPHIILASLQSHDTIFMLATNKDPLKTELIYIDLKTNRQAIKVIDLPFRYHYYIMKDYLIYGLKTETEDHQVMSYSIKSLLFGE
jgi:hypothetical protein